MTTSVMNTSALWRLSPARSLTLDRARLLAILNMTPDSFSDGGVLRTPGDAVRAATRALRDGADALDIGGESTRPGAASVPESEQIKRIVPAICAIRDGGIDIPITVDTTNASVAQAALDAGADAVNDVSAGLDDPAMLETVAERGAGIILMHRVRKPALDRVSTEITIEPDFGPGGVARCVRMFLAGRVEAALEAGVPRDGIVIDPGLGFGKSVRQNYDLIRSTPELANLGRPVVGGASRKSFLGATSGVATPSRRIHASIAASVAQRLGGAMIFRIHDVAAHREALTVADAVLLIAG